MTSTRTQDATDFYEVLDAFDTCMLTTYEDDGSPHARPMAIARREGSVVWFVTGPSGGTIEEVRSEGAAAITVQGKTRWAAASGQAAIVADRAQVASLWTKTMEAWWPDGPSTPGVVAVRVQLESAEWWDVSGGKLARFGFGLLKSLVTDERIGDEEGEHGSVDLQAAPRDPATG